VNTAMNTGFHKGREISRPVVRLSAFQEEFCSVELVRIPQLRYVVTVTCFVSEKPCECVVEWKWTKSDMCLEREKFSRKYKTFLFYMV